MAHDDRRPDPAAVADLRGRLGLTARQGECLGLYCCEGLTQEAIAARLGIAQRVVSQHISAARAKLAARGLDISTLSRPASAARFSAGSATLEAMDPARLKGVW